MAGPPVPASAAANPMAELTRGLSEKAIKFAELRASGLSLHRAAVLAGFEAKSQRNFTSIGWALTQDDRVVRLMERYAKNLVKAAAPRAVKVLDDIMSSPTIKPADRTRAAAVLLGKVEATRVSHEVEGHLQHEHQHEHTIRVAPTMDDLRREAGLLPSDNVTDAEFEEVTDSDPEDWTV